MSKTDSLYDLAKILRSKNSGPYEVTFDVIFDNIDTYNRVKNSGVITKELISELYHVDVDTISVLEFFNPAYAFKITMKRYIESGSIGDTDVFGAQQHAPLMNIQIPK